MVPPEVAHAQTLSWVHTLEGSQMTGLDGAIDVAVSPDGNSAYVVSTVDDALLVFRRDLETGALSHQRTHAVAELTGAVAVVVDPTGENVYVASVVANAISHWSRDLADGSLTLVGSAPSPATGGVLDSPSALAFDPAGTHLWAVGLQDGRVVRYDRGAGGLLSFDNAWDLALAGARDLAVGQDGSRLYITDFLADSLVVLGASEALVVRLQTLTQSVGGLDGLDGAYLTQLTADGGDLYVTALDGHSVSHFEVLGDGLLAPGEVHREGVDGVTGLSGALGLGLREDGRRLFVTGSLSDALVTFSRDLVTGALQFVESVSRQDLPGAGLDGAAGLAIQGDTLTLAALAHRAVAVFDVAAGGGARHLHTSRHPSFVGSPNLAVALPALPLVYILSRDSCSGGQCVRYAPARRNLRTGAMTSPDFRAEVNALSLTTLTTLAMSPDGGQIYVASHNEQALAVLERDPTGDELQLVQILTDGVGGVDGLEEPKAVRVSPDGRHVYVAAGQNQGLARFARDSVTGSLTFLGLTQPSDSANPKEIALSWDGRSLYLLDFGGDIFAFDRDPVSGDLVEIDSESLIGNLQQGVVSPDGQHFYVTINNLGAMIAFTRDSSTGALGEINQFLSVPGLLRPSALAMASNGRSLYVAERDAAKVVALRRNPVSGLVTFGGLVGETENLGFLEPHRLQLSADERHIYLSGNGNRVVVLATGSIFRDDFESGDTSAWSATAP